MEFDCSQEMLKCLEDFVRDMGETADAYTTLGGTYLYCDDYPSARQKFNKAIALAKPDDKPTEAGLVADYGLVVIDFLEKKIDEDKYKTLTKEIKEKLDEISSTAGITKFTKQQCNCPGALGLGGRQRKRVCIEPCP